MNRAPAPVTSIEDVSLNWLWAVPKLPRLSSNHLAVSGCTVDVPPFDQLGRLIVGWVTGGYNASLHTRRAYLMARAPESLPLMHSGGANQGPDGAGNCGGS